MTTMTERVGEVINELGVTVRGLARRPAYALLTLATIVLGVGGVTAGYGLLHHVVLRPFAFEESERLLAVRTDYGGDPVGVTAAEHAEVAEHSRALESVGALVLPKLDADWTWSPGSGRRPLNAVRVTEGFFPTLGIVPELGALGEQVPGERRVLVSRGFWQRELGGDPRAVGRALRINGEPYVLAGVLPASFEFPLGAEPTEVWIPFTPEPVEVYAGMPLSHLVVGRLAPGRTPDEAAAELRRLVDGVRAGLSDAPGRTEIRPLEEDLVGSARRPLMLVTLAGALLLLVASLDLSMLVAARNVERREELKVRSALGASRGRLVRHLLSETGVLALVGGAIAAVLASLVLQRLSELRPEGLERLAGADVGPEAALVALGAAAVPALAATVIPAFRMAGGVRELGSRGASTDRSGQRFAWILSAVQSCTVFALLVVATLVIRSLQEVTAVDPGFDSGSTVALDIFLPPEAYAFGNPDASATLLESLEERLMSLPRVRAAGTISNLPLSPEGWSGELQIEGREEELGEGRGAVVDWELVSPGYFEAMGIPLVRGRGFDGTDRGDAAPTVIVNETLARRWWPDGDAIGARLSGGGPLRTVVGVVGDVKVQGLHMATRGSMYLPALQTGAPARQAVVVRVEGEDPGAAVPRVRSALLDLEPDLAVGAVRTLDTLVRDSSGAFRLRAVLLGTFAALALLLGMAGIYGITAHGVRSRRRDIGIRMAMGAAEPEILRSVLTRSLTPVLCGLAGGLVAVLLAGPAVRGFLYGVAPTDPAAILGIAVFLLASAGAAVAPSALRARRVDPAAMLRDT